MGRRQAILLLVMLLAFTLTAKARSGPESWWDSFLTNYNCGASEFDFGPIEWEQGCPVDWPRTFFEAQECDIDEEDCDDEFDDFQSDGFSACTEYCDSIFLETGEHWTVEWFLTDYGWNGLECFYTCECTPYYLCS